MANIGIKDTEFIRGNVPMTKEEIRILSVAKLQLEEDSIVYDIGAGTGSVSIVAALQCVKGTIYAIERNSEGVELIHANKEKFGVTNLQLVEGTAPDCLETLPAPTHVFIGGSGGKLIDIIRTVREKNPKARFVLNAVTLETLGEIQKIREAFPEYEDIEVIQVGVSKSRKLGEYHLMTAENPVYIITLKG